MKKTRILIADDHDVVRSGLRMLLRSSPDFSIVGEAADGEEAVKLAGKHKPDIAILDISKQRK
jgi:DNA-binding NarL/FixJ family response regulator